MSLSSAMCLLPQASLPLDVAFDISATHLPALPKTRPPSFTPSYPLLATETPKSIQGCPRHLLTLVSDETSPSVSPLVPRSFSSPREVLRYMIPSYLPT
ncbi:uncharacterized protein LY79DRAFT_542133 [Colletotrichum navitas]|uniref:Uncharacterized protein n=1 Tax=Colletotrichum navitas TaxID=681940 RepID=A0AAD8Q8Q4_9PEZI|nr:uncharacterized protein LY79DRAFT_542133 [Colletotrichum navitas]KAK1597088.1 hypothetical protein LY79DRAFT_542133 [Colletotrichum navitas]